jgi:PRC-barrel domain
MPGEREKNREDAMPHTLVPSDRVEHANVYGQDGAKLGTIERLMLDKTSGTVAYAVIKTGGLLASHHHYPVRWDALRFDPARHAFVVELTLEDLRAGPSEFDEDDFDWGDRSRSYPHPHYWTV